MHTNIISHAVRFSCRMVFMDLVDKNFAYYLKVTQSEANRCTVSMKNTESNMISFSLDQTVFGGTCYL